MTLKHLLLHPLTMLPFWHHGQFGSLNAKGMTMLPYCKKSFFCNYCKRNSHIISQCTRRPPWKLGNYQPRHPAKVPPQGNWNQTTLHAQITDANASSLVCLSLTLEYIRDMIHSSVQSYVNNYMAFIFPPWIFIVSPSILPFLFYLCLVFPPDSLILGHLAI